MNPIPSDVRTFDPPVPFAKVGNIYSGACRCGRPLSVYMHTSLSVPVICDCQRRWHVDAGHVVERVVVMPALCVDLDGTVRGSKSGSLWGCVSADDVELLPNAETVLTRLVKAGYFVIGVTNQGPVGKGFRNEVESEAIQDATRAAFKVDPFHLMLASYAYEGGNTPGWNVRSLHRKPNYGMLAAAEITAREMGVVIDWNRSQFVGDMDSDQECAAAAGVRFFWAKDFFGRQDAGLWCEHDNTDLLPGVKDVGESQCNDCGMVFLYCPGCSDGSGSGCPIHHAPPECQ